MNDLTLLHAEIDSRVRHIRENAPDWPCAKGCDGCCHRLAEIPELTRAEWECLQQGLAALPPDRQERIARRIEALATDAARPVVCPILDLETGACPIYAHRPVACRTYGFYVQRDRGLYCGEIEARVAAGALNDVVWGNHDGVDARLQKWGEKRRLTDWFAARKAEDPPA